MHDLGYKYTVYMHVCYTCVRFKSVRDLDLVMEGWPLSGACLGERWRLCGRYSIWVRAVGRAATLPPAHEKIGRCKNLSLAGFSLLGTT